jgi:SPX domain protein involved in polyphosphate accumulation
MAKREHASSQSQDTPKQAAGGGPSRSSNPQAVNQPANTNHRDYMTVKVSDEKKEKMVKLLRSHAQEGKPYTVNELQTAAGSVHSALSLYPSIHPDVRVLYDEMAKQEPGTSKLRVTKDVARSLSGLASFLEDAPPVRIREQKKSVRGTKG